MTISGAARVDLHCHSTASEVSKLGVQRAIGLPECATPPEEVYELAKRRGMDFVTITDHDAIDGAMEIAERYEDAFVSEELTAWFKDERQAIHLLCLGITPDDHEWLQANRRDVEAVAEYLHDREIACSLAHPFFYVGAPLTPRHRRRLAQLFDVWEVRNGARARELNAPASIYIDTHGGAGTGGSDDHGGVDIGRTWTQTPPAANWREYLDHVRAGNTTAGGAQGSAAKWTHSAVALAIRSIGRDNQAAPPDPGTVLRICERVMSEGDMRAGETGRDIGPEDGRAFLSAYLNALDLGLDENGLLAYMQSDEFSHGKLYRRARQVHEQRLAGAVDRIIGEVNNGEDADILGAATEVFDACVSVVPYAPATAFLGREKSKLVVRDHEPRRVAIVADGIGGTHGVTRTLEEIRARGVPGFDVEVIGTDRNVDRRLSAVREIDIPFYEGLTIGVPSLPATVEEIAEGRYDLVHVCSPGPAGAVAALVAKAMKLPLLGSYHTELAAYARMRTGQVGLEFAMSAALAAFHSRCEHNLTPSEASDATLAGLGIDAERIGRWSRGVDTGRFSPERREEDRFDSERINVLYAGRLTKEKGAELLADSFLAAHERDPRLHLLLAGGGPEEGVLRERLGDTATFLGWQSGLELATTFASADMFLFCSETDTFGQVILEAQASGLPVVAIDAGGPAELIVDGQTGRLLPADAESVADAVVHLAASAETRRVLAAGGLASIRERTWERSLEQLATGYSLAIERGAAGGARRAA